MPVPVRKYTPVQPTTGGKVHATNFRAPLRAACGAPCDGWRLVDANMNCERCITAMLKRAP